MKKLLYVALACSLLTTGCVHKVVTVPVKVAYKTTKGVVKGTTKVVKAVTKNKDKTDDEQR